MSRETGEPREEYPQDHDDTAFRKPSPLPPGDVQEAFLRWGEDHVITSISKTLKIIPEKLLDIYEDTTSQHIVRRYFGYYRANPEEVSDKRFREYYNWKAGSEFGFSKMVSSYFSPGDEGSYRPSMIHWCSENVDFPYNPMSYRQSLFLQNPQFGVPSARRNQIRAIIEIPKYQELYVEYSLVGLLDNLALTSSPVGNERKPKYQIDWSLISRGEAVEFDFGDNSYGISCRGESVELVRAQEGKIKDKITFPGYINHEEVVDRLYSTQTLENPVEAPWQFDDSWRKTNIYDALGIKWQRT